MRAGSIWPVRDATAGGVQVRRAQDRTGTTTPGTHTRHSFSFGSHYDPANTCFGLLLAHNDEVIKPGHGYALHPHRDLEILTWVCRGALTHRDSAGRYSVLLPGAVQRLSAGSGVEHSETNEGADELRLVQMWVAPDGQDRAPSYEQRDVGAGRGLVPLASGRAGAAGVGIGQRAAALHVARVSTQVSARLPAAPFVHLFVATGTVTLEGVGNLDQGDAARLTRSDGRLLSAPAPAEVLVWEMHAGLQDP